jgi:hypothetical protein
MISVPACRFEPSIKIIYERNKAGFRNLGEIAK